MSNHSVDVVEVHLEPHPNADSLSIVRVGGFTCCVRTADWNDGDLGAYIPPDSVVDSTRDEFAFLAGHERIRVKKLRGVVSMGLLVKAPAGLMIGDDAAESLGVKHYDPPLPLSTGGESEAPPPGYRPVYDVENLRRYTGLFVLGEELIATEKIHGASARYVWLDGRLRAGSRTEWKREDPKNLWWQAAAQNPVIGAWCSANPGLTLYGEVYGQVQDLKYGARPGQVRFAAFDILNGSEWLPFDHAHRLALADSWVPTVWRGVLRSIDELLAMAEGRSLIPGADHIREGIVVRPAVERTDPSVGRVQFKVVSSSYLERA